MPLPGRGSVEAPQLLLSLIGIADVQGSRRRIRLKKTVTNVFLNFRLMAQYNRKLILELTITSTVLICLSDR